MTARSLSVAVLAGLVSLSIGAHVSLAFAANATPVAAIKDSRDRTSPDIRSDVKRTPVHNTHVKFRGRLDHNINRYANRSAQMMGREVPDLRNKEVSPDLESSASNLDVVMLVQADEKPVDIRQAGDRFGGPHEKTAHADQKDGNAGDKERNADRGDGDHPRHVAIKRAASKKVKRISERIVASDNPSGDSGGGGEQAGTIAGTQGPQAGAIKEFTLGQGSALIAHRQHVVINTGLAKVHVLPGSIAYVAQFGKTVSVYNLGDVHDGDVHLVLGGKIVAVPVGQHVVLTQENEPRFEAVNHITGIQSRNAASDGTMNGVTVYHAEFSPTSALDHIKQFEALINSKRPDDRKLSQRLIKTAAVLMQMRPPFTDER